MAKQQKTTEVKSTKKASKKPQKKVSQLSEADQQARELRKFLYPHATD